MVKTIPMIGRLEVVGGYIGVAELKRLQKVKKIESDAHKGDFCNGYTFLLHLRFNLGSTFN